MASRMASLRASFLTGIVVIAPVGLTVWLIWTVIGWVDGFVWPFELGRNVFSDERNNKSK